MGKAREMYPVTLACFYLSRKHFCSIVFALERDSRFNFVNISEAKNITYYRGVAVGGAGRHNHCGGHVGLHVHIDLYVCVCTMVTCG